MVSKSEHEKEKDCSRVFLLQRSLCLSNKITQKSTLIFSILESKLEKIQPKMPSFSFDFPKGKLSEGQRRPFSVPKVTF